MKAYKIYYQTVFGYLNGKNRKSISVESPTLWEAEFIAKDELVKSGAISGNLDINDLYEIEVIK